MVLWTSASYAVVMLLVGLPLWWKTTAVQRVELPYHDMLGLHDFFLANLQLEVQVDLKGFTEVGPLEKQYDDTEVRTVNVKYSFRQLDSKELDVLYNSQDLYEIDKKLCAGNSPADLNLYYVGREDFLQKFGHKIILGNCRNFYYISNSAKPDWKRIEAVLSQVTNMNQHTEHQELPLSASYNVLLSLLVPEPEVLDADWEVKEGVQAYLNPILEKLAPFAEFTVRSQILYYVKLNLRPRLDPVTKVYGIPAEQLPLVINPVETKLTSFVSPDPALNFVTYVSPCSYHPMQILNEDRSQLESNAFFVPQWGGILVYNGPCPNSSHAQTVRHSVPMTKVMSVIISQFRDLIGVPQLEGDMSVLDFRGSALRDWEFDLLLRNRLQRLLFTSANTLMSLGNLLDQITNIVVTEEVGAEVQKSVKSLKLAYEEASLSRGSLQTAQQHAIRAYKASEIAFHHPTNLAQLYFPDDQKYAIYIPLFLPVGIPVILSLKSILEFRKKGA